MDVHGIATTQPVCELAPRSMLHFVRYHLCGVRRHAGPPRAISVFGFGGLFPACLKNLRPGNAVSRLAAGQVSFLFGFARRSLRLVFFAGLAQSGLQLGIAHGQQVMEGIDFRPLL